MYSTLINVQRNRFDQLIDDYEVEGLTQRSEQIVKASSEGTSGAEIK